MSRGVALPPSSQATVSSIWSALAAIYLIWGSTYLAIRFTVESVPPFLSAAARFLVSGAFLFVWRRVVGDAKPTLEEWRNASTVGIFLLVGGNGGVVWAAQFIPSSLSALLVATVPLWMLLFDTVRPGGVIVEGTVDGLAQARNVTVALRSAAVPEPQPAAAAPNREILIALPVQESP